MGALYVSIRTHCITIVKVCFNNLKGRIMAIINVSRFNNVLHTIDILEPIIGNSEFSSHDFNNVRNKYWRRRIDCFGEYNECVSLDTLKEYGAIVRVRVEQLESFQVEHEKYIRVGKKYQRETVVETVSPKKYYYKFAPNARDIILKARCEYLNSQRGEIEERIEKAEAELQKLQKMYAAIAD